MKSNSGCFIAVIAVIISAMAFGAIMTITSVASIGGNIGIIITAVVTLILGGMFFLFYKIFFKPLLNARRLQRVGLPGKAKVLSVSDTGVTINKSPMVKLELEVKNSFGQRYTTSCRVLISRLNPTVYTPGMDVMVKIDPDNEKNVMIDFAAITNQSPLQSGDFSSANTEALKTELEQLEVTNSQIKITGRPAKAIVKTYTLLGINVNGNNPYVQLEVEVLPEHSPSFSAVTKGVIAETAVHKFQPGSKIAVKYDYYDNSKVVIDHS